MRDSVMIQNKKGIQVTFEFFKKDLVFTISFLLAAASCLVHTPKMEYINFHVLVSLFNLMLAIKAFEELRVMDKFAISLLNKCQNSKSVSMILILMCFVSSMFVTNDVALLTFVPLTVVISRKTKMPIMETVILQTIAANIGSSLTPMGNPQNLFIYSHYGI
ncbi:MAG TPA: SLC13 family permease, partial [Bacillus sp. (in: firmicutes)]|nr:SLC13 family permease [Bacillus sp. (in: firmicutes)]